MPLIQTNLSRNLASNGTAVCSNRIKPIILMGSDYLVGAVENYNPMYLRALNSITRIDKATIFIHVALSHTKWHGAMITCLSTCCFVAVVSER